MILKILEKIGRKKIVLDRGPSHPDYKNAKPWMERYYLLFRHRPKHLDNDLVRSVTRFLREPPGNYQGVPVFSRSQ